MLQAFRIFPIILFLEANRFYTEASLTIDGRSAVISGDYTIGMLLPIHIPPDINEEQCTKIWDTYGIHRAEMALRTIREINKRSDLLPSVTLGIEIHDECWHAPVALFQTISFIMKHWLDNELLAVIGPSSSAISIQVQNLLQPFGVPQVGYSATSTDLDDRHKYKYFTRVVPSDEYQVRAILDVIEKLEWTRVSVVYTKDSYGRAADKSFQKLIVDKTDICVDQYLEVSSDDEDEKFSDIVTNLRSKHANVVVCFCEGRTVRKLLKAVKRLNLSTNPFVLVGSDGWADREDVVHGVEKEAVNSISLRINSPRVADFDDYFRNLTPSNNEDNNPWFGDYWESYFNCSIKNGTCPSGPEGYKDRKFKQDTKLSLISKSIYKVACALDNVIKSYPRHDQEFIIEQVSDSLLREHNSSCHNRNITGSPLIEYEILSYQKINSSTYEYITLGHWSPNTKLNLSLHLLPKRVQYQCSPLAHARWKEPLGMICLISIAIGCLTLSFTLAVFLWYRNTPVVKSSARELSYIMLVGMIINQASVATLVIKPTLIIICILARSAPLISFTMVLGVILAKTNRMYRLLANSKREFPKTKQRFMSTKALISFTLILVLVEVLICVYQFLRESPEVGLVYYDGYKRLECKVSENSVLYALLFNIMILLWCTYYAFKTRHIPENFNEAKYVGFGMYTVCVIWLSALIIYMTNTSIILISRAICITLSNWALWIFIFARKLYVILFRQEKNTRDYFRTAKNIRLHIGNTVTPVNSVPSKMVKLAEASSGTSGYDSEYIAMTAKRSENPETENTYTA